MFGATHFKFKFPAPGGQSNIRRNTMAAKKTSKKLKKSKKLDSTKTLSKFSLKFN